MYFYFLLSRVSDITAPSYHQTIYIVDYFPVIMNATTHFKKRFLWIFLDFSDFLLQWPLFSEVTFHCRDVDVVKLQGSFQGSFQGYGFDSACVPWLFFCLNCCHFHVSQQPVLRYRLAKWQSHSMALWYKVPIASDTDREWTYERECLVIPFFSAELFS